MGISHIFVTIFGRYPCRRWHTFSSGKFSAHRLRNSFSVPKFLLWYAYASSAALEYRLSVRQSDHRDLLRLCQPPSFRSQQLGTLLYIAPSPTKLDCSANCFTVTGYFRSHCFVLTVSLLALVKTPGNHLINASFSDYPSHSFCKRVSFIWTSPS